MAGWELRVYFREDEAFALTEAECAQGWMERWWKRQGRGQPFMASYSMLRFSNLTARAMESQQRFLTKKDFQGVPMVAQ